MHDLNSQVSAVSFGTRVDRPHAATHVFHQLAGAILRKQLQPGRSLPPERELADRFGVSRIVVREAIHRLKDYQLVQVRQGAATTVLDADRVADIRILTLRLEVTADDRQFLRELIERQRMSGAVLLTLAEGRIDAETLSKLREQLASLDPSDAGEPGFRFVENFWQTVAEHSGNLLMQQETMWWLATVRERPWLRDRFNASWKSLYGNLLDALQHRRGAGHLMLDAMAPQSTRTHASPEAARAELKVVS